MVRRSLSLFAVFVLGLAAARAEDLSAVLRQDGTPLSKETPARKAVATFEEGSVEFVIDPTKQQGPGPGVAESLEQRLRLVYRQHIAASWLLTYETAAGMKRQGIGPFESVAGPESMAVSQSAALAWKPGRLLSMIGSGGSSLSLQNDRLAMQQATRYGVEAVLAPFTGTQVRGGVSREMTLEFDQSLLTKDAYSVGLEQTLPWVPVTLRVSQSATGQERKLLNAGSGDAARSEVSGVWKVEERIELGAGYEFKEMGDTAAGERDARGLFGQVQLRPVEPLRVQVRGMSETVNPAGGTLPEWTQWTLTFGVNVKLAETWDAGVSLRCPLVEPADGSEAPAHWSLSARAEF